jgi:hypothetical protein
VVIWPGWRSPHPKWSPRRGRSRQMRLLASAATHNYASKAKLDGLKPPQNETKRRLATMFDRPISSTERKIHGSRTLRPRLTTNTTSSYTRTNTLASPWTVNASVTLASTPNRRAPSFPKRPVKGRKARLYQNEAGTSRPAGNKRGLGAGKRAQA